MPRWVVFGALVAASAGAAACAATESDPSSGADADAVVVASFDFAESRLLAEIYAQALEDEGITVDRQLGLGPRELAFPALQQGFVDVLPEYAGSALVAAAPQADVDRTDTAAVVDALSDALAPMGLVALTPAEASNENAVAVTRNFAARRGLETIGDLAPVAGFLRLGGPPECPERAQCLLGMEDRYGLHFREFVSFASQELVGRALEDGIIEVGVMFTTDAALAGGGLTVLADDRGLQPAENVVPVVRRAAIDDERVVAVLDDVSARLTTSGLRFLNWRVANAGTDIPTEARAWLVRQGLIGR